MSAPTTPTVCPGVGPVEYADGPVEYADGPGGCTECGHCYLTDDPIRDTRDGVVHDDCGVHMACTEPDQPCQCGHTRGSGR